MAEVERRSKPRKVEPKDDEETEPRGHGILLLGYFVGGVAILIGMVIVAGFLSGNQAPTAELIALGVTAVVAALLFVWGKLLQRQSA